MPKQPMTDVDLRRRKKLQARLSIAGGSLGLAALGTKGASVALAGKRMGHLLRIPEHTVRSQRLNDISTGLTTAGAGLGGAGAFNFAAYTKAESKKRQGMSKSGEVIFVDFGLNGVHQGQSLISKAYDPEEKRLKRLDRWADLSAVGAGATGTGAVLVGRKAIGRPGRVVPGAQIKIGRDKPKTTKIKMVKKPATGLRAYRGATVRGGLKQLGKAGALGLTGVGLAVGSHKIREYKHRGGASYPRWG